MTIYLYSANDNWVINQIKNRKTNLRNAVVDRDTRRQLALWGICLFKNFISPFIISRLGLTNAVLNIGHCIPRGASLYHAPLHIQSHRIKRNLGGYYETYLQ